MPVIQSQEPPNHSHAMSEKIPQFVIAGQPNEGKTTVIATLTEDDGARRGHMPGTTRELKRYAVSVDGIPRLTLFDTPGFENPGELFEWFDEHASRHDNPAAAFLSDSGHLRDYPFDCEILKPIAEGAAVIHVIDPSRSPLRDDEFEIEIFRLCGVPRVGLLNHRSGSARRLDDWLPLLRRGMNTWREFDACQAVFRDRVDLLDALAIAVPEWQLQVGGVIEALENDWRMRLASRAAAMVEALRRVVSIRVFEPCDEDAADVHDAKQRAAEALRKKIRRIESGFRQETRGVFHHSQDHWRPGDELEFDLFDERVWRIFGFSKRQVVIASVVAGAGTAALIDIALGGATLGLVSLLGGAAGGSLAFFTADKAVDVRLPGVRIGPFSLPRRKLGGRSVMAGVQRRSMFPSVLLDRMFAYVAAAARWAHGRPPAPAGTAEIKETASFVQSLSRGDADEKSPAARISALIELWHRSAGDAAGNRADAAVTEAEHWLRECILEALVRETTTAGIDASSVAGGGSRR